MKLKLNKNYGIMLKDIYSVVTYNNITMRKLAEIIEKKVKDKITVVKRKDIRKVFHSTINKKGMANKVEQLFTAIWKYYKT